MEIIYPDLIAKALQLPLPQVRNTIGLLESGATIPFISRYRKEMTGGLNEVQITDVKNWLDKLTELKARKDTILNALEKQEKLTPELKARIESSWDSNEIEDIYLPYKPKRVTRAEMARKGAFLIGTRAGLCAGRGERRRRCLVGRAGYHCRMGKRERADA